jgi:hypothetical protein
VVDITVFGKVKADGTPVSSRVGACRSCGEAYNAAGLLNLERRGSGGREGNGRAGRRQSDRV